MVFNVHAIVALLLHGPAVPVAQWCQSSLSEEERFVSALRPRDERRTGQAGARAPACFCLRPSAAAGAAEQL